MVNIDDFVKRLELMLEYYGLNASSFADKIGVQRSGMSHLLSGRNKPSLDFVLKILEVFPEIDLYWILIGKGNFLKSNEENVNLSKEVTTEITKVIPPVSDENFGSESLLKINNPDQKVEKMHSQKNAGLKNSNPDSEENEIEKIIFFYKNGRFKTYIP
nr:helix-turn-helix transcriptional regulator [uncultured Flavobacterium sp.]